MIQSHGSIADMLKKLTNKNAGNPYQPKASPIQSVNSATGLAGQPGGYAGNPHQPMSSPIKSYNSAADIFPNKPNPYGVPQSVMDFLGEPLPGNEPGANVTYPQQPVVSGNTNNPHPGAQVDPMKPILGIPQGQTAPKPSGVINSLKKLMGLLN